MRISKIVVINNCSQVYFTDLNSWRPNCKRFIISNKMNDPKKGWMNDRPKNIIYTNVEINYGNTCLNI